MTNAVGSLRSLIDRSRSWQKSGSVKAPERRSGAATNSSSARYPAAKPPGYQSTSTPCLSTRPATPRKDAAERYSPLMAAAFQAGLTSRGDQEVRRGTGEPQPVRADRHGRHDDRDDRRDGVRVQ